MKRIWLENYRCFRERQEARLAPLTLLVGDNSTGKTSFLAMIRALWDIAYRQRVPDFKEEPYDLGSYQEIAHFRGGRGGPAASFMSGFEIGARSRSDAMGPYRADTWSVEFAKRDTVPRPTRVRFANVEGDFWVEERYGETTARLGTPRGEFSVPILHEEDFGVQWLPELFVQLGSLTMPPRDRQAVKELVRSAKKMAFYQPLFAGAPVRSKPHRTYDPARIARDPEGDYVPMFLARQYFEGEEHWCRLVEALQSFGKDAGLFDEIAVKALGKQSDPFQLQVRRFDGALKGPQRNLIDVGYGVSQVLPVITELLRQDAPEMFLLQQPEVHLHPRAQAALGSLFYRIARWDRQLIIETHSDHLLDRVRMDVRDGTGSLKPEDVSILYFERGSLDVRIHTLRFDAEGNIQDAPQSYRRFFMDEVKRTLWKRDPRDRAASQACIERSPRARGGPDRRCPSSVHQRPEP